MKLVLLRPLEYEVCFRDGEWFAVYPCGLAVPFRLQGAA